MKNIISIICLIAAISGSAHELTFMSYNVRNGIGMDRERNYQRVAEVIMSQTPDVVAVQEVDSMTNRSGNVDVLAHIADASGMNYVFSSAIDYDGGRYGIGILSKVKPISVSRYSLPGREERRTLIVAEFDDYYFSCTHLSLTPEDCLASTDTIRRIAKEMNKPFFIAGDFNSTPDSDVIGMLKEDFTILSSTVLPTFPADNPDSTLDYIMQKNDTMMDLEVVESSVIYAPDASDHRPVLVKVNFKHK